MNQQASRANAFHQMHAGAEPLVLANAWDVASARIIENAGAAAVATSSAAMAWSLGYADGEQMPLEDLLGACRRIAAAVAVPLTVDIERGYGSTAEAIGDVAGALIELGAAGINIEDGKDPLNGRLADAGVLAQRIARIRAVAGQRGVPLFINARTDTYLTPALAGEARFEQTHKRALAYIEAGADGIFIPGLADAHEIERLAALLPVPLNIYAGYPAAPAAASLRALGVRRISLGCGTMQAVLAHLARIAGEALREGRFDCMSEHMLSVGEVNGLFTANAGATRRLA